MTDKFKLIKELGLEVTDVLDVSTVDANELERILEKAPRVYGQPNSLLSSQDFHLYQWPHDTHTAILVGIKEIEKKKCEHEASSLTMSNPRPHKGLPLPEATCEKCGAKLKAEWKEIE